MKIIFAVDILQSNRNEDLKIFFMFNSQIFKETGEMLSSGMEGSLYCNNAVQHHSPMDSLGKKKLKSLRDEDRVNCRKVDSISSSVARFFSSLRE